MTDPTIPSLSETALVQALLKHAAEIERKDAAIAELVALLLATSAVGVAAKLV